MSQSIIETLLSKICFVKAYCQISSPTKYYVLTLQEAAAVSLGLLDSYIDTVDAELRRMIPGCVGQLDGVYIMKAHFKRGGCNV